MLKIPVLEKVRGFFVIDYSSDQFAYLFKNIVHAGITAKYHVTGLKTSSSYLRDKSRKVLRFSLNISGFIPIIYISDCPPSNKHLITAPSKLLKAYRSRTVTGLNRPP